MTERLISAQELAEQLAVHKYHIGRLIEEKRIPEPDFVVGAQEVRGWTKRSADAATRDFRRLRRA